MQVKALNPLNRSILGEVLCFSIALSIAISPFCWGQETTAPQPVNSAVLENRSSVLEKLRTQLNAQIRMELKSQSFSEDKDSSNYSGIQFSTRMRWDFTKHLYVKVQPLALLGTGRIQSRFEDSSTRDKISLKEAFLGFNQGLLVLKAGALSQSPWNMDFTNSEDADGSVFAGISGGLIWKTEFENQKLRVKALAQQAIPSSRSLNTQRNDKEELPSLQTQTLEVKYTVNPAQPFEVKPYFSKFNYKNLPAITAEDSSRLGNSINGDGAGAQFRYGFAGYGYGVSACWDYLQNQLTPYSDPRNDLFTEQSDFPCNLGIKWKRIKNQSAPEALSKAEFLHVQSGFLVGKILTTGSYGIYFKESDVTPASYAQPKFGGTNRKGEYIGLRIDFLELGFGLKSELAKAEAINTNPVQSSFNSWFVGIESRYVWF